MASRKRKTIDLDTKCQILQAVDKIDKSKTEIAKAFEIPPSTLSTIIKQRETIMKACNSSDFGCSRKKMRTAQHTDVEDALYQWFKNVRDQNIPISGPTLATKADDLAIRLSHTDFTAKHNWVERFKQRRGIVSRNSQRQ
jgi:centromere protein B